MNKKRVGILRGGEGENYNSSLKKGGEIISHILENLGDKYQTVDILIDRMETWHINGMPIQPVDLLHKIDIGWNLTRPSASVILNNLSIPHVSNGAFSGAMENSREMLREHMQKINVDMPRIVVSPKNAREVFEKFPAPWIVKIYNEAKIAKTFDELAEMINGQDEVVVEEFITGKVASVHSVPGFRGQDIYIFPLGNAYGIFSAEEKEKLSNLAKDLHTHLGAKHYLKSDFILNPRGKVYLLQIESTPDLKPESHFSQVCLSVGAQIHQVIDHILERA